MKKQLIISALCAALFCACNGSQIEQPADPGQNDTTAAHDTTDNGVRPPKQMTFSSADEQLLYRTNEFSFNLLGHVAQNEPTQNIILSPLSASMMMGMVMNGATDETLAEMQSALGFEGLTEDDVNAYYRQLIETLPVLDTVTRLSIANSLWIHNTFLVKQAFVDINSQTFNATSRNVDMHDPATADIINQWAADNTNDLIKNVVRPAEIYECVMVLANALYFKSEWALAFDKDNTHKEAFTTLSGETVQADMMHLDDNFKYAALPVGQLLEMDYKGGQYCMDILLPAAGTDIRTLLSDMTVEDWNGYLKMMYTDEVFIALPKIKLRYNRMLTDDLKATGIRRALSPAAQFSRVSDIPTYLAWVKQLCYLAVDEEGTEAAAVTIGGYEATGMPDPRIFVVDRPYLIVIREKRFGNILFTAMIGNPNE